MVEHCYTIDYSDHQHQYGGVENALISRVHTNAGMYALGDKYGIDSLKIAAKTKFELIVAAVGAAITRGGAPIERGGVSMGRGGASMGRGGANIRRGGGTILNTILGHIIDVIPIIYNTTQESDRGLHAVVVDFARQYPKVILAHPLFKTMISGNVDFVVDVFGTMVALESAPS